MTPEEFYRQMMPYALSVSQQTGVDPRIVIAQSAIETGYGKHAPGNNFFGIKGQGGTYKTTEYGPNGPYTINDSFRGYNSMGDSAMDYAKFINTNPRYTDFRNAQGMDAQLAALQKSGYATDPNYSAKVGSIAKNISLDPNVAAAGTPAQPTNVGSMIAQKLGATMPSAAPMPGAPAQPTNLGSMLAQRMGFTLPAAPMPSAPTSPLAGIGGILSAMGQGQQPTQMIKGYEHRPDPKQFEDIFGGLLS